MDGSPQLLTDVKFTQLKRGGYDPDQVDNFLERVSAAVAQLQDKLRVATERAEAADAQIAEARRLQAEAEARAGGAASATDAEGARVTGGGDEEITKVLLLAQRAADQAVEEANTNATRTMADARAKAVNLLAEAEQERDRMLAKARKKADAAAEERARQLQERVELLLTARAELEGDLDALQTHLDRERALFQERLESVQRALDDPRGFRLAEGPALSDPTIPAPETDDETDEATDRADADAADSPETDAFPGDSGDDRSGDHASGGSTGGDDQPVTTTGAGRGQPGEGSVATGGDTAAPATATAGGTGFDDGIDTGGDAGTVAVMTATDAASASEPDGVTAGDDDGDTIDLTSQRLFGDVEDDPVGHVSDSGPATQAYRPTDTTTAPEPASSAGASPLGEPDAEADAAMRAFFDADPGDSAEPTKTRFGRRR
jgi:DivIVA domain-containing protein